MTTPEKHFQSKIDSIRQLGQEVQQFADNLQLLQQQPQLLQSKKGSWDTLKQDMLKNNLPNLGPATQLVARSKIHDMETDWALTQKSDPIRQYACARLGHDMLALAEFLTWTIPEIAKQPATQSSPGSGPSVDPEKLKAVFTAGANELSKQASGQGVYAACSFIASMALLGGAAVLPWSWSIEHVEGWALATSVIARMLSIGVLSGGGICALLESRRAVDTAGRAREQAGNMHILAALDLVAGQPELAATISESVRQSLTRLPAKGDARPDVPSGVIPVDALQQLAPIVKQLMTPSKKE